MRRYHRVTSFKIEDDLLGLLEEYARKRGLPKSEVIRRALKELLLGAPDLDVYKSKRWKIYA